MRNYLLYFLLGTLLLSQGSAMAGPKKMKVIVQRAKIHKSTLAFSETVATVKNGDTVLVHEEKGSWVRVSVPGAKVEGWMFKKSVQGRWGRLFTSDDKVAEDTSAAEAARAGRGFDEQVEAAYKKKNPNADFSWIEKCEKDPLFKVSDKDKREFVKQGKLGGEQ